MWRWLDVDVGGLGQGGQHCGRQGLNDDGLGLKRCCGQGHGSEDGPGLDGDPGAHLDGSPGWLG